MFSGSLVALITPFREDGAVDEAALEKMVEWHIDAGTAALVPVGTTGESPVVTHEEHLRIIELVTATAKGRIPVIAGAGSNNPVEAVAYTQKAQAAGADAVLSVAGYYNRPSQEGLYAHFRFVHDETDVPVVLYNIPARCVVDISVETVARLSTLPRVVGVKDATGDMARLSAERQRISTPFCWLSGDDLSSLAYNITGGSGCISVTANVAPKACAEMHAACQAGDYVRARTLHEKLFPLHTALMAEPNPAGPKYAASLLGLCREDCRLPAVPLSEATRRRIEQAMQALELI
ncbi:4-hydroxy-tetrahydrodipicolinate synthase [Granulosicoccaceae sp. 1_MG-2023]|nr:4-hydroxy-tetrahydrodipicolinate synthase [Granulosicoccaceae sp. 1_MG-2023]